MSANTNRSDRAPERSIEARYDVERTLGQGSAGVVYQVVDRETGERLALKKLLRMDLKSVTRLKAEFRALADLHHPNLIKLYDLGHAGDAWYITMEHLSGSDILTYLRGYEDPLHTLRITAAVLDDAARNRSGELLGKLATAFLQLARGIRALHRAGMLHRDLKPSNVMVAQERVVVLDFGLVREVGEHAVTVTAEDTIAGTPAYMAPEQVLNSVLSEATDWYAFGAMLYEALSGELPLQGKLYELLRYKLDRDPTPLAQLMPQLPEDVCNLCMALLARDPTARPSFDAISEVLAPLAAAVELSTQELAAEQLTPSRSPAQGKLVGRTRELAELARAHRESTLGRMMVVHVRGQSGAGKSALVEQFLEQLEQRAGAEPGQSAMVLRARCYEREAMPFKALDGLLESLVRHLLRLDELVVSHLLPMNIAELTRAFPVLERLPPVTRLLSQGPPARGDSARERSRAERALRELLRRVAMHWSIVLWIDDLQWGDIDSVAIVKSWLETSESLPMLLVLSYRGDEHETNACLKLLTQRDVPRAAIESSLDIQPLSADDVEALCLDTFGAQAMDRTSVIERIIAEAQGSPFLARQLLTLAQARSVQGAMDVSALSIDGLVSQVTALLGEAERALLTVLAVAGRPVTLQIALRTASIRRAGRSQLHALTGLNLTRMRVVNGTRLLEVYHDRIREAVVAALTPAQRVETQRRLLAALEQWGQADADWLHVVATGAEDHAAALRYGLEAAEHAVRSLAFERAVTLFRECLTRMADAEPAAQGEVWKRLGDALAASGSGSRAAAAYLEACQRAPAEARVELTRVAATHSIRSGLFAQGEVLVQEVLDAMHIHVPSSDAGLIAAIAWERLRLTLRGFSFEPRQLEQVDKHEMTLAVTYSSLSIDTQAYDPLRAALFQARALRVALAVGEPLQLSSALCVAATMRSVSSSASDHRYVQEVLDRAQALAEALDNNSVLARARVLSARAMCAFLSGNPVDCLRLAGEADGLYAQLAQAGNEPAGEYYHRLAVNAGRIGALFQLGRLREAGVELNLALSEARATQSHTALLHLSMVLAVHEIATGQSERARTRLDSERAALPPQVFGPLHMLHMVAVVRVGSALGDYPWMTRILDEMWPRFERSIVRHSVLALLAYAAHARFLLSRQVVEKRSESPTALVRSDLKAMANVAPKLWRTNGTRFVARAAHLEGQHERALAVAREHLEECEHRQYRDEVERARFLLGKLVGGSDGERLCTQALTGLADIGVQDPLDDVQGHFPEFWQTR